MPVYVDQLARNYGGLAWCHMMADTDEELKSMARLVGLHVNWRHGALRFGALERTSRELAEIRRTRRTAQEKRTLNKFQFSRVPICHDCGRPLVARRTDDIVCSCHPSVRLFATVVDQIEAAALQNDPDEWDSWAPDAGWDPP